MSKTASSSYQRGLHNEGTLVSRDADRSVCLSFKWHCCCTLAQAECSKWQSRGFAQTFQEAKVSPARVTHQFPNSKWWKTAHILPHLCVCVWVWHTWVQGTPSGITTFFFFDGYYYMCAFSLHRFPSLSYHTVTWNTEHVLGKKFLQLWKDKLELLMYPRSSWHLKKHIPKPSLTGPLLCFSKNC